MGKFWMECLKYGLPFFLWFTIPVSIQAATGLLQFSKFTIDLESFPQDATLVDLNNDDLKDIFIITRVSFMIFLQKESGFSEDPDQILEFAQGIGAVDIGEVDAAGGKEIVCIGHQGVFYYKQQNDAFFLNYPQTLIEQPTLFSDESLRLLIVDFARDLNSDGLDELLIPTKKGMMLFWQHSPNIFAQNEHFPIKTMTSASANAFLWPPSLSKISQKTKNLVVSPEIYEKEDYRFQDVNNDGLVDILIPNPSQSKENLGVDVFLQTSDKEFLRSIEYSKIYSQVLATERETLLLDINMDGIVDKISLKVRNPLEESSLIVPTIQIAVFINKKPEDFASMPSYIFRSVYLSDFIPIVDIDQDGSQDIFTIYADLGLTSKENIIKLLTKGKVNFLLRCYLFNDQEQGYSYSSDIAYPFAVKCKEFADISEGIFFNFTGDFDGNGIRDFCFREKANTLSVMLMRKKMEKLDVLDEVKIYIPTDTALIKILDINHNGKADLVTLNESGTKLIIFINQDLLE